METVSLNSLGGEAARNWKEPGHARHGFVKRRVKAKHFGDVQSAVCAAHVVNKHFIAHRSVMPQCVWQNVRFVSSEQVALNLHFNLLFLWQLPASR